MEYRKIINLLDNTPNQPSKFRTKKWVEVNDNSHAINSTNSQIEFKTLMLRSSLYQDSNAFVLVSGTITVNDDAKWGDERGKKVIFKNCASFTNCINKINNMQVNDVQEIDVVTSMYSLIKYSDNYWKTSGSL